MHSAFTSITTQQTQTVALSTFVSFIMLFSIYHWILRLGNSMFRLVPSCFRWSLLHYLLTQAGEVKLFAIIIVY